MSYCVVIKTANRRPQRYRAKVKNDGSGISPNRFEPLSLSKAVLKAAARSRQWVKPGVPPWGAVRWSSCATLLLAPAAFSCWARPEHEAWAPPCRVSSSVRPRQPSSPVRCAEGAAEATHPFRPLAVRSFPSRSRSHRPGRSGCTKSKLDGYRMAARIDNGRVQLLTRTGLEWTGKYPSAMAALANLNVKTRLPRRGTLRR